MLGGMSQALPIVEELQSLAFQLKYREKTKTPEGPMMLATEVTLNGSESMKERGSLCEIEGHSCLTKCQKGWSGVGDGTMA